MIDAQHLATAKNARPIAAVTFHFTADRLRYIDDVLSALANYPVSERKIVVFTNTAEPSEHKLIKELFEKNKLVEHRDAQLVTVTDLPNPHLLTWAHKRLIVDEFLALNEHFTHFIYVEDDEPLIFDNFAYFVAARDLLRSAKLLPGFLRTEWSMKRHLHVSVDIVEPVPVAHRSYICHGEYVFVDTRYPYCGAFILDRELAREYVRSRSFDPDLSSSVAPAWGVRERAAMGLTLESAPAPFSSRVVLPVSLSARTVPACALLPHLPNTYADMMTVPLSKVATKDLFLFTRNQSCPCGSGKRYKHCHGEHRAGD